MYKFSFEETNNLYYLFNLTYYPKFKKFNFKAYSY